MAESVEGIKHMIEEFFADQSGQEIERTVSSCATCLHEELKCYDEGHCEQFVPKNWRDHVLVSGEWWS